MLKWRLALGSVMIIVLVGLFVLDWQIGRNAPDSYLGELLKNGLIVAVLCGALCAMAAYELYSMARPMGYRPFTVLMVIAAGALPLVPMFGAVRLADSLLPILLLVAFVWQFARERTEGAMRDISLTIFGIMYLGVLPAYLIPIRTRFGIAALATLLLTVKCSDMGAYFIGRALGRHKLVPWLSPGKTIEGLFGGLLVGAAVMAIVHTQAPIIDIGLTGAVAIGLVLSLAGHFGDLAASLIKRDFHAKDSSKLMPGLGGILDLIDSVIPAGFIWYLILTSERFVVPQGG